MLRPSKRPRLSTRTFTSKAWSVSPKVHAYRFVVTPDEAITRFDAFANQWRPAAGLDWKSSRFGLVYFPIWYTGAELRCNLDIESEDTTQRADLSLLGGMPGHYDQFLSTLNYQSYLPAVGKLKVPPSRRFTEPILRQHDHPIFPLPFNISPFIFDILDFESTGVQLTEGISISQNPKILFNAAFPVLVPLYVANYEAKSTSSKETYVQYHCIEAFSKELSSHFSTTFIQSSPEESREHHTHPHSQLPNQPPLLPPGLQMNFLLHREEEEYVEVRDSFMSLLLEARETPDILRGLHKKLPLTMDDIRVRPLKELELEKMHKFIAALRPLNEFEHLRDGAGNALDLSDDLHSTLQDDMMAARPDWWSAYRDRRIRLSSRYAADQEMLKPSNKSDPIINLGAGEHPPLQREPKFRFSQRTKRVHTI